MDRRNAINESLVAKHQHLNEFSDKASLLRSIFGFLGKPKERNIHDGGPRSEAEGKVYSWIYALAQAEKDLVFEYVKSTERGLSFTEAERRLKERGRNVPLDLASHSWWKILWNAFVNPFNIILIIIASLSYIASDNANGTIMLTLVFISVGIRFHQVILKKKLQILVIKYYRNIKCGIQKQEYRSSRAAMQLSELLKSPVRVQRCAGRVVQTELIVQIDQKEIVPGDIIIVSPGDLFPGDVRLLTSKDLVVSQSSLTGESGTTEKIAGLREDSSTPLLELKNICFMGTSVTSGCGTGLVISTGSDTYMSTIFSTLGKEKVPNAFEKGVLCVSYALVGIMVAVVPIIVLLDYCTSHRLSASILFGISVAVALTPQMLPLIVNTNLAKGAMAMARGRCIVKSLSAIQNMGAMDILCIDKTGTLTMDLILMVNHVDSWGFQKERVLRFAFLNSYLKTGLRSPTDAAILAYVYTNGYRFESSRWRKIDEIPFDFSRRRMSVIAETQVSSVPDENYPGVGSIRYVITKGAIDEVLRICTSIEHIDTRVTSALTLEDRQRILQISTNLNNDGLRVLGVAIRKITTKSGDMAIYNTTVEADMVFLGLLSFFDPPKDSAKQALWQLAEKGVKAKVLTGDSLSLAIRVCKEVGIRTTHVTTGPELELLGHDEFHETVKRTTVLARLTPIQKLRVVQSLRADGEHVVGFLGDGINDSLALDSADVGISVDCGVTAAKEVADIILVEKDLNVLVYAVELGRITHGNTMKYIKMSLVANIGCIVSLLIATAVLKFEPLTPRQLLTQNFLYNLSQIAIPWDKMEEDYVKTPRRWSTREWPIFMLCNGPVSSIFDTLTFLFLQFYYGPFRLSESNFFRSAWFVEGLLMQALIIHMIRSEKLPFIQDMASWPVMLSTITICAVGVAIPFTPIGIVMGLTSLPLSYFGFLIVLFIAYFSVGQIIKRIYILFYKQWL